MIDVEDATFAQSETVTLDNGSVLNNVIKVGRAGDCYAAGMCDNNKKGSFSVDLTDTGLTMPNTFDWGYPSENVWPTPNTMVCSFLTNSYLLNSSKADYIKTDLTASARCGGWCGFCKALTESNHIPIIKYT